jgi:hypothetical protein
VLFYSYSDSLKGRHMIATSAEENNTAREVVEANLDALNAMVRGAVSCWAMLAGCADGCVCLPLVAMSVT